MLVNVSTPSKVANVPVVGKIRLVDACAFKVVGKSPVVVKLPPMVIVLPVLATPVPPFAPRTIPVTLAALPPEIELFTKSFTALLLGYFVSKSFAAVKSAVPVKFEIFCFKSKADCVAVLIGLFMSDVLSTRPKPTSAFTIPVGAVITGLVIVLFVKVSVPANVANVPVAGKTKSVSP